MRRSPLALCMSLLLAALGCASGDGAGKGPEDFTIYTHDFPDGIESTATGEFYTPAVRYPPITIDDVYEHILTFRMTPMAPPSLVPVPTHGPVILYTDDLDVIVFSPLDHFYVSLIDVADGEIRYGIEGEVEAVPPGFSHSFLLVRGRGINATVERWGEILRAHYGRARTDRYADIGASYIGYWTDNGAYYYYGTEPGMNEADTLLAVKVDADAKGIPYGYMQLDSWWYFKARENGGGLVRWEPKPSMFPDGLETFQARLGLPRVLHNRCFAAENDYRDDHPFIVDDDGPDGMALPLDRGVFDEFMENARTWGAFTYEQDWLISQYWGIPYLREGVGRAETWMDAINDAAADQGLTLQLCMAGPAHFMDSVRMPSATTIRTSIDYIPNMPETMFWPQFHTVNMIAWAVGLLPFKDNFQTTPHQRPILSEPHGAQEALISALSAGMVGPSDRVGTSDAALILRTCRADGLLLKPDRPATPIDAMFLPHERPFITTTWSHREGIGVWRYVAAYSLFRGGPIQRLTDNFFSRINYGVPIAEMFVFPERVRDRRIDLQKDLGMESTAIAYNWRTGSAFEVEGAFDLPVLSGRADYAYFVLAPVLTNGLALIGEVEKFVTLADRRFTSIEILEDGIHVDLDGVPGESVTLRGYDTISSRMLDPVDVEIGPGGTAEAVLRR